MLEIHDKSRKDFKKMAPASKAEKKAALDVASWMFNVVTSVGVIIVNKTLMATYSFSFATTLTGMHFTATTLMTAVLRWLGYIQPSHLPLPELLKFVFFANFSIVGMNVSLMWNSVGFYQFFILLSCTIAVGTNLSQFICIGRFTAVSFQVLGHMKTILVLILGSLFFGKEGLNVQVVLGMVLAVVGMIWYGNASSKPGGKERRSHSIPNERSQKQGGMLESNELDEKI